MYAREKLFIAVIAKSGSKETATFRMLLKKQAKVTHRIGA
jgi:hypothetical protein